MPISFCIWPEDAPYLAREFVERFEQTDLMQLPNFRGTHPVKATFRSGLAREIVCPLTGKLTGTQDDDDDTFRPRATATMDCG